MISKKNGIFILLSTIAVILLVIYASHLYYPYPNNKLDYERPYISKIPVDMREDPVNYIVYHLHKEPFDWHGLWTCLCRPEAYYNLLYSLPINLLLEIVRQIILIYNSGLSSLREYAMLLISITGNIFLGHVLHISMVQFQRYDVGRIYINGTQYPDPSFYRYTGDIHQDYKAVRKLIDDCNDQDKMLGYYSAKWYLERYARANVIYLSHN